LARSLLTSDRKISMTEKQTPTPRSFDRVARFLMHYGDFLAFWSTFDMMVEILIMRELGTTEEKASIMCASLGFGAKANIACSLLNGGPSDHKKRTATLLREAQQLAERNSFAHGFFLVNRETQQFELIKREVRDAYIARIRDLDCDSMAKHTQKFIDKVGEMQSHADITEDDFLAYTKEIEAHALDLAFRDKPHPEPPTSSSKAKKKSPP
jgi:hypothetical protein